MFCRLKTVVSLLSSVIVTRLSLRLNKYVLTTVCYGKNALSTVTNFSVKAFSIYRIHFRSNVFVSLLHEMLCKTEPVHIAELMTRDFTLTVTRGSVVFLNSNKSVL